jgi:hypothetical protein
MFPVVLGARLAQCPCAYAPEQTNSLLLLECSNVIVIGKYVIL